MLGELLEIASDFFVLGLIPAVIAFIVVLVYTLKKFKGKRYYGIKALLLAIGACIATFVAICIIIYIVMFWLLMVCLIILVGAIVIGLVLYVIGEIIG